MSQPPDDDPISHALMAWQVGVRRCDARHLVNEVVCVEDQWLRIGDQSFDLDQIERIRVVGAGKAARAMVEGLNDALGLNVRLEKRVAGWVNVPEQEPEKAATSRGKANPGSELPVVWPFEARPVAENLPTVDCYAGTLLIEDIVERTTENEICIALISGGGSALLTHPARGVTLDEKRKLTSWLSFKGASIAQLNTVRKHLSQVKGGRLAARFRGHHLAAIIVSDVLHHGVEYVASGPTVQDQTTAADALQVLRQFDPDLKTVSKDVVRCLHRARASVQVPAQVTNHLAGDVQTAIEAASTYLKASGYQCETEIQENEFETVDQTAERLVRWLRDREGTGQPLALVSGGEPVIELSRNPGKGGRNQQLVLAAASELMKRGPGGHASFALLSAGTDGEDGNTNVAGAVIDSQLISTLRTHGHDPTPFLKQNNSYEYFQRHALSAWVSGLKEVETNVCDLRVVLVSPVGAAPA